MVGRVEEDREREREGGTEREGMWSDMEGMWSDTESVVGVVVGGLSGCLDPCYRAQTDRVQGCSHCLGPQREKPTF